MVEGLRIEADENGFELVIEGDLVEECEAYLAGEGLTLRLNIQSVALAFANSSGLRDLIGWREEAFDAMQSHRVPDDGDGYTPDDPKSEGYHDRLSLIWDAREGK